jgi:hypothetical protein
VGAAVVVVGAGVVVVGATVVVVGATVVVVGAAIQQNVQSQPNNIMRLKQIRTHLY